MRSCAGRGLWSCRSPPQRAVCGCIVEWSSRILYFNSNRSSPLQHGILHEADNSQLPAPPNSCSKHEDVSVLFIMNLKLLWDRRNTTDLGIDCVTIRRWLSTIGSPARTDPDPGIWQLRNPTSSTFTSRSIEESVMSFPCALEGSLSIKSSATSFPLVRFSVIHQCVLSSHELMERTPGTPPSPWMVRLLVDSSSNLHVGEAQSQTERWKWMFPQPFPTSSIHFPMQRISSWRQPDWVPTSPLFHATGTGFRRPWRERSQLESGVTWQDGPCAPLVYTRGSLPERSS